MRRDLRELFSYARESFASVQLEWTADCDAAVLQRAFERSVPDFEALDASGAVVRFEAPPGAARPRSRDGRFRYEGRAWWRRPSCWRDDVIRENGATTVNVVCGADVSAFHSAPPTLLTNRRSGQQIPRLRSLLGPRPGVALPTIEGRLRTVTLVDPAFLASGWELSVLGERTHAGRETIHVQATRLDLESGAVPWEGVNRYELLVDRQRGVLLRCAGIVDGVEAGILSVRSVVFDEPIPDEVFSCPAPKGTRVVWV
ncbi:MAG TPA: hypothetical protein VF092_04200 [Longimicrobium sp.]